MGSGGWSTALLTVDAGAATAKNWTTGELLQPDANHRPAQCGHILGWDSLINNFDAPASPPWGSVTWEGKTERLKQSAKRAGGGTQGMATVILMPAEPAMKRATAME